MNDFPALKILSSHRPRAGAERWIGGTIPADAAPAPEQPMVRHE